MKLKVVIKVVSMNNQKSRSKALKIVVSCSGVEAAGFKGEEKDQIEVTGEGVDAAELTNMLRKSVGHADIVSVGPVEVKKEEKKEEATKQELDFWCYQRGFSHYPFCEYRVINPYHDPYCSFM